MIIVMSDLHFADSSSFSLDGHEYNHNLPAEVYSSFFHEVEEFIHSSMIEKIDLVLAGDIFEITRNPLWLKDHLRPYLHNDEIIEGGEAEARILEIIEAINRDERVHATLELFRNLGDFFAKPVQIHFVPGNHDRLANASAEIRKRIQELLGLEANGEVFENQFIHYGNGEPRVVIRHGHEYDRSNFSANLRTWSEIPLKIDKSHYDKPVLGDIVTIEIAAKLPFAFREHYSDAEILSRDELMVIYKRLIDFDNVRPANALVNFLFTTPGMRKRDVWEYIEPAMVKMLDDLAFNPRIGPSLIDFGHLRGASAFTLRSVLSMRLWRFGLPFWLIKALINPIFKRSKISSNLEVISREECLQAENSPIRCIVSGHTHDALVELLKVENGIETYYINSGTFRNVITSTPNMGSFGRLRSKARVLIFKPQERNPEYDRKTGWSFDFHSRYGFGAPLESNKADELIHENPLDKH